MKYDIQLRDLHSFESISSEIDKLDLFNSPRQFNEINDQLYDEWKLRVNMKLHGEHLDHYFEVTNDFGNIVFTSEHYYGSWSSAAIQGLFELANYIKDHPELEYTPITDEFVNKTIKNHETRWFRLPSYIRKK